MKDIMLKIVGKQFEKDQEETAIEFVTEGKLYEKGQSLYLVYEESQCFGVEGCKTRLKLVGDTMKMNRYDDKSMVDTEIQFEKGHRAKGYYVTPFGPIEMEVLTSSVENTLTSEGEGFIDIEYQIALKGLMSTRSQLKIEIM